MATSGIPTHIDRIWLLQDGQKALDKYHKNVILLQQLNSCIDQLFRNPRHPGLNLKQVDNIDNLQVFSARINKGWRTLLIPLTQTELGLLTFGTQHDNKYSWLSRERSRIKTKLVKVVEIEKGKALSTYIGMSPVLAFDKNSHSAMQSATQFHEMVTKGIVSYLAHLDESQRALVKLNVRNLLLIKGGAGTGKTAVALHRLVYLAKQDTLPLAGVGDVLYLCYNNNMAEATHQLLRTIFAGNIPDSIKINTFHRWSAEFLNTHGEKSITPDDVRCKNAVYRAFGRVSNDIRRALDGRKGDFVENEIEHVIKPNGFSCFAEYANFDRTGIEKLKQSIRQAVWEIYKQSQEFQELQHICRYSDLPLRALERLRAMGGTNERPSYRAILIDEGQDCSPVMIRLARELLDPESGQITVMADPAQAIYDCGFQWTQREIKPKGGNVRWLKRTYRTTHQIYQLVDCLLDNGPELREDYAQMEAPERSGPMPEFIIEEDEETLLDLLSARIVKVAETSPYNQIAILAATWARLKPIAKRLEQHGIPTSPTERYTISLGDQTVKLLSFHGAKGLDFPNVFVIAPKRSSAELGGLSQAHLPKTRNALYVALTRSSNQLTVGIHANDHHQLLHEIDDRYYKASGSGATKFKNTRNVNTNSLITESYR